MIDHAHPALNERPPASRPDAASEEAGADDYLCPCCGLPGLTRIRRRFIDHVLSLFVAQRRFRCTQPGCQWQGNLRKRHTRMRSDIQD